MRLGLLPKANLTYLSLFIFGMSWEILAFLAEGDQSFDAEKISHDLANMFLGGVNRLGGDENQ